jgi:striatin 1/3/4
MGGVSKVLFANSGLHLISAGNDGAVRIWDLRNHQLVQEVHQGVAHHKKYDEAVLGLAIHPEAPFFASAGADCIVNIYELNL